MKVYRQIDFVTCQQRYKNIAANARSYEGTILISDYKLAITNFALEWHTVWRNRKKTAVYTPKINTSDLVNETNRREEYQGTLNTHLEIPWLENKHDSIQGKVKNCFPIFSTPGRWNCN